MRAQPEIALDPRLDWRLPLPVDRAPFFGRDDELALLARLLAGDAVRLITLIGVGGVGKTRLALEAARRAHALEAAWFVPLAAVASPDSLPIALAEALTLPLDPGSPPAEQLLGYLESVNALLVLDNFEHLIDGGGIDLVANIAARCPGVRLLVTSRARLGLRDEWVVELGGLALPDRFDADAADGALALFFTIAGRTRADFSPTREGEAALEICRLIEGLPLAIEHAAAWIGALSCAAILDELRRGLDILAATHPDFPPRHGSMRAVLDASWARLPEDERRTFAALSTFRGGFTLDAARAVAGLTLAGLARLIDACWVRRAGEARYDLHELLRQYGGEHLAGDPSALAEAERRHALYHLAYLNRCERALFGPAQKATLDALAADLDNLHAALLWLRLRPSEFPVEPGLGALWFYFDTRGRYHEGERFFAALLDNPGETVFHAGVLAAHGAMCFPLNRPDESLRQLRAALAVFKRHESPLGVAFCLCRLAITELYQAGGRDIARQRLGEALAIYRAADDQPGLVTTLNWLSNLAMHDDGREAMQMAEEALSRARMIGDEYFQTSALSHMGTLLFVAERYHDARAYYREALERYQALDVGWGIMMSLSALGQIAMALRQYDPARAHFQQTLRESIRLRLSALDTMARCCQIFILQGDLERAVEILAFLERYNIVLNRDHAAQRASLNDLAGKLPPDRYAAAVERGLALTLDAARALLLALLAEPAAQLAHERLTARERDVLRLLADGLSNRQIADQLVFSLSTVKWYVSELLSKLGVRNRTQLVARARELGLIS